MSTFTHNVRISEKTHTRLRMLSFQRKITTAEMADKAIKKYLDREERVESQKAS